MIIGLDLRYDRLSAAMQSGVGVTNVTWDGSGGQTMNYTAGDTEAVRAAVERLRILAAQQTSHPACVVAHPGGMKLSYLGRVEQILRENGFQNVYFIPRMAAAAARLIWENSLLVDGPSFRFSIADPECCESSSFEWCPAKSNRLEMLGSNSTQRTFWTESEKYLIIAGKGKESDRIAGEFQAYAKKHPKTKGTCLQLNFSIAAGAVQYLLLTQQKAERSAGFRLKLTGAFGIRTWKSQFLAIWPDHYADGNAPLRFPEDALPGDCLPNGILTVLVRDLSGTCETLPIRDFTSGSLSVRISALGKPILQLRRNGAIEQIDLMARLAQLHGEHYAIPRNSVEATLRRKLDLLRDLDDAIAHLYAEGRRADAVGLEMIRRRAAGMLRSLADTRTPQELRLLEPYTLQRLRNAAGKEG